MRHPITNRRGIVARAGIGSRHSCVSQVRQRRRCIEQRAIALVLIERYRALNSIAITTERRARPTESTIIRLLTNFRGWMLDAIRLDGIIRRHRRGDGFNARRWIRMRCRRRRGRRATSRPTASR